ncbi:MAG: hypothetical protein MJ223_01095 [Mycoplasmoidaceae bacterium]|nr:hypothetical protein [Mycoplasmoidaceae bacterium]
MFALSMTLLVASFASTAISMPLIIGMFALAIVGFMGCLAICGRMRRRLNSNEDTSLMIRKTFKKSLLPLVDISFITLIFGICLTYIAPITYNPLGVVLICGSFAIFISIYLINAMLHGLFFNNRIMVNRFEFFGKPTNLANQMLSQGNANIPSSLDATNLTLPYFSTMSKKKIDATGKKALIAIIIVALALVAGIVFFTLLGFVSSEMFHTTTCVSIKFDGDLLAQDWFRNAGLTYTSYRHDLLSNM